MWTAWGELWKSQSGRRGVPPRIQRVPHVVHRLLVLLRMIRDRSWT